MPKNAGSMNVFISFSPGFVKSGIWSDMRVPCGTRLPPVNHGYDVVIQWGSEECMSGKVPVFNPLKAVARSRRFLEVNRLLNLNGISGPLDYEQRIKEKGFLAVRRYLIPVFNLQALSVFYENGIVSRGGDGQARPTFHSRFRRLASEEFDIRAARMVRLAIRALYCLGLDFGSVVLEQIGNREIYVRSVHAVPDPHSPLGRFFVRAINRYAQTLSENSDPAEESVVFGADPEFIFRGPKGKIVPASFRFPTNGNAGWDNLSVRFKSRPWQRVHPLGELRPKPGKTSRELFFHLVETIQYAWDTVPDPRLEWIGGAAPFEKYPLGGHLHVSGIWLNVHLLRALDNYLALPFGLIEPDSAVKRRPRFGFLGDFRRKPHGGFEYRTLSSWLADPHAAKGVISLLEVIVRHYWKLCSRPLDDEEMQRRYYKGDKVWLLNEVKKQWKQLERLETYQKYERDLLPLKEMIFSLKPMDERNDFKWAWKNSVFS